MSRRTFLTLAVVGGAAALFSRHKNTVRTLIALSGGTVDWVSGLEKRQGNFPYDTIAVPGAGVVINEDGSAEPNEFEKLRLEAATLAYIYGFAPKIILLDGAMGPQVKSYPIKTYL